MCVYILCNTGLHGSVKMKEVLTLQISLQRGIDLVSLVIQLCHDFHDQRFAFSNIDIAVVVNHTSFGNHKLV